MNIKRKALIARERKVMSKESTEKNRKKHRNFFLGTIGRLLIKLRKETDLFVNNLNLRLFQRLDQRFSSPEFERSFENVSFCFLVFSGFKESFFSVS